MFSRALKCSCNQNLLLSKSWPDEFSIWYFLCSLNLIYSVALHNLSGSSWDSCRRIKNCLIHKELSHRNFFPNFWQERTIIKHNLVSLTKSVEQKYNIEHWWHRCLIWLVVNLTMRVIKLERLTLSKKPNWLYQ